MAYQGFKKSGFTLIELLIVIAIIGILSAIVLGSLNTARNKSDNAAVQGDLHNITAQAQIIYDSNGGNYQSPSDMCVDTNVRNALDNAGTLGSAVPANGVCFSSPSAWAVSAPFKVPDNNGNTFWCVDSTGAAKGENAALVTTVCT